MLHSACPWAFMLNPTPPPLYCPICHKPVAAETSKTNEFGIAVHEECYVPVINKK